jgi:hypothetical protein
MFEQMLITNRGDQSPLGDAVAKPNCAAAEGRKGDFAAGETHV